MTTRSPGLAWYLQRQTTEAVREELDRAVQLELHLREMRRTDPANAATYTLSLERAKERTDAAQAELVRRSV